MVAQKVLTAVSSVLLCALAIGGCPSTTDLAGLLPEGESARQSPTTDSATIGPGGLIADPRTTTPVNGSGPEVQEAGTIPQSVSAPDPFSIDTDGDGLSDGDEAILGTSPISADTDGDTIPDAAEGGYGTDPRIADTDVDGLSDGREIELGTHPLMPDTDADGLIDGFEVDIGTDPKLADTDGDTILDGVEISLNLDPLVPNAVALVTEVYCSQAISIFDGSTRVLYTGPYFTDFSGWLPGDTAVIEYPDENDHDIVSVTNLNTANTVVASNYGTLVSSGVITNIALYVSWIELDYAQRWHTNPYDAGPVYWWALGDRAIVCSAQWDTDSDPHVMWFIVNLERCESVLLSVH